MQLQGACAHFRVPKAAEVCMAPRYAVLPAFLRLMPALRIEIATACSMAFLRDAG